MCRRYQLFGALIYLYTRALRDYMTPFDEIVMWLAAQLPPASSSSSSGAASSSMAAAVAASNAATTASANTSTRVSMATFADAQVNFFVLSFFSLFLFVNVCVNVTFYIDCTCKIIGLH